MAKRKSFHLIGGSEEGQHWDLRLDIREKTNNFIGYFRFYTPPLYKSTTRNKDWRWVASNIPSSIWWGKQIHHDWENGARMYILDKKEHRRRDKK